MWTLCEREPQNTGFLCLHILWLRWASRCDRGWQYCQPGRCKPAILLGGRLVCRARAKPPPLGVQSFTVPILKIAIPGDLDSLLEEYHKPTEMPRAMSCAASPADRDQANSTKKLDQPYNRTGRACAPAKPLSRSAQAAAAGLSRKCSACQTSGNTVLAAESARRAFLPRPALPDARPESYRRA